ncbi:unnamed protein product [Cyclocybe aegerita]|uniref:Nephrocystin 3-like N-terminal domain-containing protein n=1 Tax=Cyclocybe aegerita TaxID=1973307 RepID=A0A8S0WK20_CYCAE|nr:unnamed protein product [Cyclocybe aegerita]
MFKNSQNVQITGGTFTAVTTVGGIKGTSRKDDGALLLVREHSALNCLLDSNERFDPPRCDPDTRVGIIRQILDWVSSDDEVGSITIMHGSAGAGKSALEQSIAELCSKNGRLAASFFFSRTAPHRRDGNTLIPTLVFQIAHTQPILRPYIEKAVEADPALFEKSRSTQLEKLLVEPFLSLNNSYRKRQRNCFFWPSPSRKQEFSRICRLVIIDGLDECQGREVQCDLLRIIGEVAPRLPFPFRFLIASRPESHVMHTLTFDKIFQGVHVRRINLDDDLSARSDIHTFLTKQFTEICRSHPLCKHLPESWPTAEDILELVKKASTQFIYASIVMNYIGSRRHRPDHRLRIILGLLPVPTKEKPFAQLDVLYSCIFSSVEDLKTAHRILGIIYLSSHFGEKFNLNAKCTSPVGLEEILQIQPGDVELALDDLLSLVVVISRDQPIKIFHASLFDFLLDASRSEDYRLDLTLAHDALANYYLGKILPRSPPASRDQLFSAWWDYEPEWLLLFLKHCQYGPVSKRVSEFLLSMQYLPFHSNFLAAEMSMRNLDIDWTSVEPHFSVFLWKILSRVEAILLCQDCDIQFSLNLIDEINLYLVFLRDHAQVTASILAINLEPIDVRAHSTIKAHALDGITRIKSVAFLRWMRNTSRDSLDEDFFQAIRTAVGSLQIQDRGPRILYRNGKESTEAQSASLRFASMLLPHCGYSEIFLQFLFYTAPKALAEHHGPLRTEVVEYIKRLESSLPKSGMLWELKQRWRIPHGAE